MAENGSVGFPPPDDAESVFMICGICKKTPSEASGPKLLPCLHTFCEECLSNKFRQQQSEKLASSVVPSTSNSTQAQVLPRLKCPTCGQEFLVPPKGIRGFLDNQFLLEAQAKQSRSIEATEKHVCTSCEDNSAATSYCVNCVDWLCDACVSAHQRVRMTKDHQIQSEEEFVASKSQETQEKPLYCPQHPQEPLQLFCANCEKLTCRDCQLVQHKDHRYQFLPEAAVGFRDFVRSQLNRLYDQAQPLTDSIKDVEKAAKTLQEKEQAISEEIQTAGDMIIEAVKRRQTVLMTELKALVQFKHKLLAKQNKDLRLMQKILQHNYGFTRHVLKTASDSALLYTKKQLSSRVQNLLSLKYRVNPIAHSDLKFSVDTEKICGLVNKTGTVVTPADKSTGFKMVAQNSRLAGASTNSSVSGMTRGIPGVAGQRVNPLEALSAFNKRLAANVATVSANLMVNQAIKSGANPYSKVAIVPKQAPSSVRTNLLTQAANNKPLGPISTPSTLAVTINGGSISVQKPNAVIYTPIAPKVDRKAYVADGRSLPLRHFQDMNTAPIAKVHPSPPPRPASSGSNGSNTSRQSGSPPAELGLHVPEDTWAVKQDPPVADCNSIVIKANELENHTTTAPVVHSSSNGQTEPVSSATVTLTNLTAAPIVKRSPSCPGDNEPESCALQNTTRPAKVKRTSSSAGMPSPVPSPMSPPSVRVKQEKSDILYDLSTCHGVQKPQQEDATSGESGIDDSISNDDWCAVCRNGGELLCCDTCPRVFHLQCHIPALHTTPTDAWSCGLCRDLNPKALQEGLHSFGSSTDTLPIHPGNKRRSSLTCLVDWEKRVCEKVLLELFCHADSVPFQQKVSKTVPNYYKVISHPMDLSTIRTRVQPQHFQHYGSLKEFVADCRLIFQNCALFNDESSEVGKMGRNVELYFETVLMKKYLPDIAEQMPYEPQAKKRREDGRMFLMT